MSGTSRTATLARKIHMEMPTKAAWIPYDRTLTPHHWTVTATSAAPGHPAADVLRTRAGGFWQSARIGCAGRAGCTHLPQTLTVTFPAPTVVSGVRYLPHGLRNVIGIFSVRLSRDGRHFGAPVATGRWQDNSDVKRVGWIPAWVRALRLRIRTLSPGSSDAVAIDRLVISGAPRHSAAGSRGAGRRAESGDVDVTASSTSPAVIGQWGPTIGFPLIPVTAALIPGNRLLVFSADSDTSFDGSDDEQYTQTAIDNLTTGAITQSTVSNTAHDMFCSGVSILPDGDVIVTGGIGDTNTSIFDPTTGTWTAGPPMNIGRGYQGQTTLSTGEAFVLGGSWSGALGGKLGEVWSPTDPWRELPGVPADPIDTNDSAGVYRADNHGWFIATSNGNVFQAGPSEEMHWITTAGQGTITDAAPRGSSGDEMNGNAVLIDVGKILTVGGAPDYTDSDATNVANIVNINGSSPGGAAPTVTPTGSMAYARGFQNSVVLPSGQVFTVGGETYPIPFDDSTSVMYPELWSPTTGQWSVMAEQAEPRNYHSVAVLLPSGQVFSGGGGLCGSCATNHPDGQIYSPPYLFTAKGKLATRPKITSAPSAAQDGQTIAVHTNTAVKSFVLIRYGEATHTVDNDQRRIPLTITSAKGSAYQLAIPSDPGTVLPGPYMLFAMSSAGVPSVAATVMISAPSTAGSNYGRQILSDGPALYWPLSDPAGSTTATDLSQNLDPGAYSSSGVSYGTPSTAEGPSGTGITLSGGDVTSTSWQMAPTTYSEELWFRTTSTAGGMLATFEDSGGSLDRVIYLSADGQLNFGVWTGAATTVQSPGDYNDGQWHFVVATQGADGMHLYVDGEQVASGTATTAYAYPSTVNWQLGGTVNNWPNATSGAYAGSLSDGAWFDSELTPAQVENEYTHAGS